MPDAMSDIPMNDGEEQNDPNSSPASQPTETPAPTPVRLPPTTLKMTGAASGSGARGNGTAKPSRFKPKIVRRDSKEREERESREREKENARLGAAAAAAARAARGTWGRGRAGRGRGAAMGRGRGVTASGPFAAPPASVNKGLFSGGSSEKRQSGPSYSGSNGGGASGSTLKTEVSGHGRGGLGGAHDPVARRFIPEPHYPDADDDAPRVDIEHINDESDSDSDVKFLGMRTLNKANGDQSNKGGLKPIRLDRKEHKERVTMVNTEPAIKPDPETNADLMVIDEGRSSKVPTRREGKGTDGGVKIKTELGVVPKTSLPRDKTTSSPTPSALEVPAEIDEDDPKAQPETVKPEPVSPNTERTAKSRPALNKKDKAPVLQTEEDRAEWGRRLEDMDILRKELSGLAANLQQSKAKNLQGDIEMEDAPREGMEDGRVYLFQFPPVLPKLYDARTSSNPNHIVDDPDFEMKVPVDLTKGDKEVKSEEKVTEIKQEELDEEELRRQKERNQLVVEDGFVGKLVLRESGKVELVWGGTNMKVGRGIETHYFSMGGVVDGMDSWKKDENGEDIPLTNGGKGKSMAMGEIMGKFVVTPDFKSFGF